MTPVTPSQEVRFAFEGFAAHRVCVYLSVIVHRSRRESSMSYGRIGSDKERVR